MMDKLPAAWSTGLKTDEDIQEVKVALMQALPALELLADKLLKEQQKSYKAMLKRTQVDDETAVVIAKFLKEQQIYDTIISRFLTFK